VLFEKPNLKRPISLDLVGMICIVVITTAYVTYGACVIYGVVNGYDSGAQITFLDLINGIAQIATALAFILAYVQFRKNRIQQRQAIIAKEAGSQLEKMISVVSGMKVGENSDLKNLNKSLGLLSNLAINFDELFKAMNEDIQKGIVRMQWQDMYFNYLSHALGDIDPVAILKKEASIDEAALEEAVSEAKRESEAANILPAFKDYVFAEKLLSVK
jgi:predicted HAD superfamily Cof-like phosphohydrolase